MNKTLKYLSLTALLLPAFACTEENPEALESAKVLESVTIVLDDRTAAKLYTDDGEGGTGVELLPMVVGGETVTLGYSTVPEDLSDVTFPEMVWSSSDEDVVTVDESGVLTAVGAGTAVVTITSAAINTVATASITVRVSATAVPATSIAASGAFDKDINADREDGDPYLCYVGDEIEFSAVVTPDNATFKGVTWSVAPAQTDGGEAVIDAATGIMTAGAIGFVTVTATALDYVPDGQPASTDIEVRIITPVDPDGIRFINAPGENDIFSISAGSMTVDYEVCPEFSTKSRIDWTSSDENIATVDDGVVTFKTYGTVEITAACPGEGTPETGYEKTASFTVNIPAGYYDEVFENKSGWHWYLDTKHVDSGASATWTEGENGNYLKVIPYLDNDSKGRADMKYDGMILSGKYPVICIKIDDVNDFKEKYSRNINIDGNSGVSLTDESRKYGGNLGGDNNKWQKKYKCSDGSSILVYNLIDQKFKSANQNFTETEIVRFNYITLKYADIKTPATAEDAAYRFFWFKTFANETDMDDFLEDWSAASGIDYNN